MGYNHSFAYQNRQKWLDKKRADEDYYAMKQKKDRKSLSKRLKAQQQPGRYTHVLDKEMFENLCGMLKSTDMENVKLAREILFRSKMSNDHITTLLKEYLYEVLHAVEYDGERLRIYSSGNVGISNISPSMSLNITP